MRILMICGALPPDKCGVGDYAHELANALADMGIELTMLTTKGRHPSNARYLIDDSIETWSDINTLKTIRKALTNRNYDIVHFQHPFANLNRESIISSLILPILLRSHSKKLIYTIHEYSGRGWKRKIRKIELKPAIKIADGIIITEPGFKEEMKRIRSEKTIFFSQVHASVKKYTGEQETIQKIRDGILKDNKKSVIMCFFGFIASNKRLDVVLNAMNILKKEGKLDSILLVCTTVDKNVEYQKQFLKDIEQLDLNDSIRITGYLQADEVAKYLMASDFGVLLYEEGISERHSAALAVLKQGKRLITTEPPKNDGFSFVDIPKEQIIFTQNDPYVLAKIIGEEQKKNIRYDICDDVFSPTKTAVRHMEIYKDILQERKTDGNESKCCSDYSRL